MYRLQINGWGGWYTVRQYKTKRAAMVNLVKRKFEQPDFEWRISTDPTTDDQWIDKVKTILEQKDGDQKET
jgi:hypothetical protein